MEKVDFSLPALDALYAEAIAEDCTVYTEELWLEATRKAWPQISARLKEQQESILELQERVSELEEERSERISREKLLTETLRGVIQEKRDASKNLACNIGVESEESKKLTREIAWLESVLGCGK